MSVTLTVYSYMLLFLSIFIFVVKGQELLSDSITTEVEYDSKWMYFPDGDGVPHPVSLEMPPLPLLQRMDAFYDIEYRLYTRDNANDYVLLDEKATPLNKTTIQFQEKLSRMPIKVITHGWESTADQKPVLNMKDAYLKTKDVAVVAVDWSDVANNFFYPMVAYQTTEVGKRIGRFLNALSDRYNVTGYQLHLIGHSLGAHVMGYAGRESKLKVSRITGLDPARPLFEFARLPGLHELDITDADFVDIIHTCSGILGVEQPIGNVDFFPNLGIAPQPGCKLSVRHVIEACSHFKSTFYFTESILHPTAFPALKCKDRADFLLSKCVDSAYMGENVNRSASGSHYLETNQQGTGVS